MFSPGIAGASSAVKFVQFFLIGIIILIELYHLISHLPWTQPVTLKLTVLSWSLCASSLAINFCGSSAQLFGEQRQSILVLIISPLVAKILLDYQ